MLVLGAISIIISAPGNNNVDPALIPVFATTIVIYITGVVGLHKRTVWGRYFNILLCIFMLIAFPVGTLIGLVGLHALIRGKSLFGESRISSELIRAEYYMRKVIVKARDEDEGHPINREQAWCERLTSRV